MTDHSPETLLPCPFCGGTAVLHRAGGTGERIYYRAICETCVRREDQPGKQAAISAWNTRTPADPEPSSYCSSYETLGLDYGGNREEQGPRVCPDAAPSAEVADDGLVSRIIAAVMTQVSVSGGATKLRVDQAHESVSALIRTLQSRIEPSDENIERYQSNVGIASGLCASSRMVRAILTAIKDSK